MKSKITKMTNNALINELQNVRCINSFCPNHEFDCCSECISNSGCLIYLTLEELITNELIERGIFDFALLNLKQLCKSEILDKNVCRSVNESKFYLGLS
ncbi:MAG: hypothetical protein FK734_06250 [Asgard group archaeon]|nr:hypothetical protein [Asgard group archaeon]